MGIVFGAVVLVLAAPGRDAHSTSTVFSAAVGGCYLLAGVIAAVRQPGNRVGLLLVLAGIGWFAEDLYVSIDPLVHTVGLPIRSASAAFLLHLVLAFPRGGVRSRVDRVLVAIGYVAVFGLVPLSTLSLHTHTPNLLLIRPVSWTQAVIDTVQMVVGAALVVVLVVRWITATKPARRVLAPVAVAGLLGSVQSVAGPVLGEHIDWLYRVVSGVGHAAVLLLPVAFLAGVWRVRLGRSTVTHLLARMPRSSPAQLQELLARALGDPSLRVGYYRRGQDDYVDL
ncbi:MAG TPA: hypothetical protein VF892_04660, partial [Pseudonocardiaceae bacterium]